MKAILLLVYSAAVILENGIAKYLLVEVAQNEDAGIFEIVVLIQ